MPAMKSQRKSQVMASQIEPLYDSLLLIHAQNLKDMNSKILKETENMLTWYLPNEMAKRTKISFPFTILKKILYCDSILNVFLFRNLVFFSCYCTDVTRFIENDKFALYLQGM